MKTVQIEDDVYTYIAARTVEIGEPATSILRRLLNIPKQGKPEIGLPTSNPKHELARLLSESTFTRPTTAVYRMLRIFQEVFNQRPTDFHKLLEIRGRDRLYFSKTKEEMLKSSKTSQPHEIDGTGFWVMTNSPTYQKRRLVGDVLRMLDYNDAAIEAAEKVIE